MKPPQGRMAPEVVSLRRRAVARLLQIRCSYCGAAAGELCRSKNGRPITDVGMMHDARIAPNRARSRWQQKRNAHDHTHP
jgi:hypothetical protein